MSEVYKMKGRLSYIVYAVVIPLIVVYSGLGGVMFTLFYGTFNFSQNLSAWLAIVIIFAICIIAGKLTNRAIAKLKTLRKQRD